MGLTWMEHSSLDSLSDLHFASGVLYPAFFLFFFLLLFPFPLIVSRRLRIDEAIQSVEEIQSVILFFSLTCLTEQKKKG